MRSGTNITHSWNVAVCIHCCDKRCSAIVAFALCEKLNIRCFSHRSMVVRRCFSVLLPIKLFHSGIMMISLGSRTIFLLVNAGLSNGGRKSSLLSNV